MSVSSQPLPSSTPFLRRVGLFLVGAVVVVLLWEAAKTLFEIPDYKLPHTYDILAAFTRSTPKGPVFLVLAGDMLVTGFEALLGFTFGAIAGFLLAVLFAHSNLAERGLLPYVIASQTVPIVALAPMVVVGMGQMGAPPWVSKSIIAAYLTFFPVTINSLRGLTAVEQDAMELMVSYAAGVRQIFFKLRFPNSLPYLFTALKISATASVIGAIIGELPVGSTRGLGVQIVYGSQYNTFNPGFLWATIIAASLLGMIFYGTVAAVERLVLRWKQPEARD
jgi:NitT/TauT family transport system permease protein